MSLRINNSSGRLQDIMSIKVRKDGCESARHGMLTQIKKMRIEDWKGLALLALAFIPGTIWKFISPNIWIITEYENLARDNGYWLFKFVKEKHTEQQVFYPISRKCSDYHKIAELGGVVTFGSFKHYCLFWAANKYIGTTKCYGFPYRRICEDIVQWRLHRFKYVFLNHGFTRGYSAIVDANETRYDMLITCAEKDKRIIIRDNDQREEFVRNLGYPRHDTLHNITTQRQQILIMPTWRNWLDRRLIRDGNITEQEQKFLNSRYYLTYLSILNNKEFGDFLDKNNLTLIFYLHEYAQGYSKFFKCSSENIIIGTTDKYDIQNLLNTSDLLITDYSSVCYDFSYMYKPVIYYQFDKMEFENNQYAEGDLFTYDRDGFGPIAYDEDALFKLIFEAYRQGFQMQEKYKERVDNFFKYHDQNNCKRVFEAIREL